MARQPDVPDEALPPELTALARAQRTTYGTVLNSTRQAAHTPPIARAAAAMGRAIERSGRIPGRINALVNLRVAGIVGCPL